VVVTLLTFAANRDYVYSKFTQEDFYPMQSKKKREIYDILPPLF